MSSDTAITVSGVSKRYELYSQPRDRLLQFFSRGRRQYFKEFWALRDVSFDVKKGETVGILGRNGSGKSTLLQIIAGTLTPTVGEVRTEGVMAALLELGSGFNPNFTGRENIYLNGSILGFTDEEMAEHFDEIVAFADIGEHLDQPIKTYSSGMAVRLAFAVQACVSPQILIVDEALSVGDEKFQRKCFEYIERLRSNGCSILLVTHSTTTVEKFCQRGVLLHHGVVQGVGAAAEIVDQYHALLYSDESTYLRYLKHSGAHQCAPESAQNAAPISSEKPSSNTNPQNSSGAITDWQLIDSNGRPCEQVESGQLVRVRYSVDVFHHITELQAGVLIRTIEGVSAYGTSTLYYDKNIQGAETGEQYTFEFEIPFALSAGTYFITLAIAEGISFSDMRYIDRKTDVLVVKVFQHRTKSSGIASLDANISVTKTTM